MKKIFLTFLVVFATENLFAQISEKPQTNWEISTENNQVKISTRVVQFNDVKNGMFREYIQYKYKNKTSKQLYVSFYIDAKYTGNTTASNLDEEDYRAFLLESGQIFTPSFSIQNEKIHFVFKRLTNYTDKPVLTSVKIIKLKTNVIK